MRMQIGGFMQVCTFLVPRFIHTARFFSNLSALCTLGRLFQLQHNSNLPLSSLSCGSELINKNLLREFCTCTSRNASSQMDDLREYLNQFAGGAVTIEKDPTSGLAIVTINNPEKRNAMSGSMMVELYDRMKDLEEWSEGKALILRGSCGNFCSGGDLDFARASGTPEGAAAMNKWMLATLGKLTNLPMFSVCLVEGPTLGGGTEISLACDFILAADNVKFGLVHGRMGIPTAWGGGTRLVRRIGQRKALELLLTSRILTAKECLEFGIVDAVVSTANAFEDVQCWLESRLQHHHTVIRAMKEITRKAATLSLDEAHAEETRIFLPFWGGELNKEVLAKHVKHIDKSDSDQRE